ncbi:hypothetical protein RI367_006742 [Sorochytrium milnesiophthora]
MGEWVRRSSLIRNVCPNVLVQVPIAQAVPPAFLLVAGGVRLSSLLHQPASFATTRRMHFKLAMYAIVISLSIWSAFSRRVDQIFALWMSARHSAGSMTLTFYWLFSTVAQLVSRGNAVMSVLCALLFLVEGSWTSEAPRHGTAETTASPLARATFMWLSPLMRLGSVRPLTMTDIPDTIPEMRSEHLYNDFVKLQSTRASLPIWSIIAHFRSLIAMCMLCEVGNLSMMFLLPACVDRLLSFVKSYSSDNVTQEPASTGYTLAFAMLLLSNLQESVFRQHKIHLTVHIRLRMQAMLTNVVFHKTLRLSLTSKQSANSGAVVNHASVDTDELAFAMAIFNDFWSSYGGLSAHKKIKFADTLPAIGPITIIIALAQLWHYLGLASLCGFAIIAVLTPLFRRAAKLIMRMRERKLQSMDARIKLVSEAVGGMRAIKLYAIERYFIDRIAALRSSEQRALKSIFSGMAAITIQEEIDTYTAKGLTNAISAITAVVSFSVYAALAPSDAPLDSARVFMSLYYFKLLTQPLSTLFSLYGSGSRALVSYRRLAQFMQRDEVDADAVTQHPDAGQPWAVKITDGLFVWADGVGETDERQRLMDDTTGYQFALRDVSVEFPRGTITAVAGRVGQGKTSLLHAVLGEMIKKAGRFDVCGRLAYVAQSAWIVNGTLRDNILMGLPMNEQLYRRTLHACSLMPDLRGFDRGDLALVGDKGVTLSGGQKARVSLARAVYSQADVYLLDDCLSAVDAHVDKHIFHHVIGRKGMLSGKTVIMVTHGVHHLRQCDRVVYVRDGMISEQGAYGELVSRSNGAVRALVSEYASCKDDGTYQGQLVDADLDLDFTQHTPLRQDDDNTTGSVSWNVYKYYLRAMGDGNLRMLLGLLLIAVATDSCSQLWLMVMTRSTQQDLLGYYLRVFAVLTLAVVLCTSMSFWWLLVRLCITACKTLHLRLLHRIFCAQSSWLDSTPAGRIISRFSADISALDETIPFQLVEFVRLSSSLAVAFVLILAPMPWMSVPLVVSAAALVRVQRYFLASSRELKRLNSGCRAPVYQLFGESLAGLVTLRAYGYQSQAVRQLQDRVDKMTRVGYVNFASNRWLGVCVNSIDLVSLMMYLIRNMCDLGSTMVAVERVEAYVTSIPTEAPEHAAAVHANWPASGQINLRNFSTSYSSDGEPVLKRLNLTIHSGEKVGICGRTGAGKSTITLSLFRIIEAVAGSIEIDGQDISKVGLADLRSRLTIIPQDPVLFQGTIRDNLDPLSKHSDVEVWRALEHASLKGYIVTLEGGLESKVENGGSNFSAGQKQLLTLAAALLRKQRIVIFDEATSATDAETDAIVQRTIRSEFKDCTVLTIAHRIATIMDSDRILVLDNGMMAEFDTPQVLLQNPESAFTRLVQSM